MRSQEGVVEMRLFQKYFQELFSENTTANIHGYDTAVEKVLVPL